MRDDASYETTKHLADSVEGKHGRVKTELLREALKWTWRSMGNRVELKPQLTEQVDGEQGRVKTVVLIQMFVDGEQGRVEKLPCRGRVDGKRGRVNTKNVRQRVLQIDR